MSSIPLATDDAAWKEIAAQHGPDCRWVLSRAGRLAWNKSGRL
jgi:hypothetical protein